MKPKNKIVSFFNALFVNSVNFKFIEKMEGVVKKMNPAERIMFTIGSIIVVVSGIMLLVKVNSYFLVEVPSLGGSITEGLVGSPRFINPILAISDTDKNISSLVYSGLLKVNEEGKYTEDLAESYGVSSDGRTYEFKIRENAYFHDGKRVTSDDVIFTINKIVDPVIKSSKQPGWAGVSVEKIDDKTIRFFLSKPYTPFLESLTLGILPKHIWEKVSSEQFPFSEFNITPVGSGPYKVTEAQRDGGGVLTLMNFESFSRYEPERPLIKSLTLKFFQNESELYKAYKNGDIESAIGISPTTANEIGKQNFTQDISTPRIFALFLNQNIAPVFLNKEVREALSLSAPRGQIVENVLFGFGKPINGPTPEDSETDESLINGDIEAAKALLASGGWKLNEEGVLQKETKDKKEVLSFSITTSDSTDLKAAAEILKSRWEELGARVEVKVFESSDLTQNIIKSRKYDSLLFGEIINENTDLHPFWHSSERNDPGLNISLYANITVDKLLEEMRTMTDMQKISESRQTISNEIKKDLPAIFLFTPSLTYLKPTQVKNISFKNISAPSERFAMISKWYIETDKVWEIFANK
jgi:peptide/nickel transport system substrate-binding protein